MKKKGTEDLGSLVEQYIAIESEFTSGDHLTNKDVIAAKMEFIRATMEFYQQIIQQEGRVDNYVGAAREQFKTKAAYREAVFKVFEADKGVYDAITKAVPAAEGANKQMISITRKVIDGSIQRIFPKKDYGKKPDNK